VRRGNQAWSHDNFFDTSKVSKGLITNQLVLEQVIEMRPRSMWWTQKRFRRSAPSASDSINTNCCRRSLRWFATRSLSLADVSQVNSSN
jgi:hypothetical protein